MFWMDAVLGMKKIPTFLKSTTRVPECGDNQLVIDKRCIFDSACVHVCDVTVTLERDAGTLQ